MTSTTPVGEDTSRTPRWDDGDGVGCRLLRVSREYRALLGELLIDVGLYPGQEQVLFELLERGPRTQAELAAGLRVDTSTVSKTLNRLERGGFVARSRREDDRRTRTVTTTERAESLRPAIQRVLDTVESRMTAGLTAEQAATLLDLLRRAEENLAGHQEEPG